jgi:hypothetical protein
VEPVDPAAPSGSSITINGADGKPSTAVTTLVGITLLSVAPALLLMMTSFTKIFVVLAMTRNAIGLPNVPPNQVLAGLALFLTFFIMGPVLTEINAAGIQLSLRQVLLAQPAWGRKRTDAVIEHISSIFGGRMERRQITVGWLLDPRAGGRRFHAWLDAHQPKSRPPWPGFPYVRSSSDV